MCGIAGCLHFDSMKGIDRVLLQRMSETLVHRGPDGAGIYLSGPVGLAHRRLSIIDLESGRQPMSNENGTLWIVFNGEIYNFQELRGELLSKGYRFKTKSDTEVLLHLYEEKGADCLKDLRGMFAFAIWDALKKTLFLARDRVGKKPLYYYADERRFIFGSEIKAILQDPEVRREVNREALHDYLTLGYTPSPGTMFRGIQKLPPAHSLLVQEGRIETRCYWTLRHDPKWQGSLAEAEDRLLAELKEAVRIRLVSDVPLGAFLSGGLDSSLVVSLMSELVGKPVKTFTIGFENEDFSEVSFARRVARHLGTEHHEFIVKPDAAAILPKLIWHYNEPFGDSSCIPTYYVAKLAREHVTVALNGDGGDESFAGYDRYKAGKLSQILQGTPPFLLSLGARACGWLARKPGGGRRSGFLRQQHFLEAMLQYPRLSERYLRWVSYFMEEKNALYTDDFKAALASRRTADLFENYFDPRLSLGVVDRLMALDIQTYLPEDLLVKMDVATMANSLEARSPFLDQNVMAFAAGLPEAMKLKGWTGKFILRRLAVKRLPKEIVTRRKMGFAVPIGHWFRTNLRTYLLDTLLDSRSLQRGYFKREAISRVLQEHLEGKEDHSPRVWALLNLELWHRMFIDGDGAAAGPRLETKKVFIQEEIPL